MANRSIFSVLDHAHLIQHLPLVVIPHSWASALMAEIWTPVFLLFLGSLVAHRFSRRSRKLTQSHAQLRAVFDTMKDGVCILDEDLNLIRFNKAAGVLIGVDGTSRTSRPTRETFDLFLPNGTPLPRSEWPSVRALRGEFLQSVEFVVRSKDSGRSVSVEISTAPLSAPNAPRDQIIVTYRDVTETKNIDLVRSRLAAIVESSDDAIIGKDENGIVTSWNGGATKVFGFTANEIVGKSIRKLLPPDPDFQIEEDSILERIRKGVTVDHIETVRRKKDGTLINVSLTISPIHGSDGSIVGASKIARDITEKRQLEKQLRQSQKMEAIGQLTGGIAHDFNNLLGVIMGNLELLERIPTENPLMLKRVQTALRAAGRGADLTRRMLTFSSKEDLRPRPAILDDSIHNTIEMASRALGPEIAIVTSLDTTLTAVLVDVSGFENALLNLLVNARDALPKGGVITIGTRISHLEHTYPPVQTGELRAGPYACISISDNGTGMSKEVLDRAFEPFYTTKPRQKGTGLGLAMVYGFVKQSGGTVRIYSELGFGTTVSFYLPLTDESVAQPKSTLLTKDAAKSGSCVLVVDDEEDLLDIAVAYLEEMGYTAYKASNAASALSIIDHEHIDLILTDIIMPGGMNGVELVQKVRQVSPHTRIAYCSGFSADVLEVRSMPLIDGPLLQKPYHRTVFADAIHRIMKGEPLDSPILPTQERRITDSQSN